MADEYISKQAFNNAIREAVRKYPNTFYNGLEVARQIAHDMSAADIAPVKHGRWIKAKGSWFTPGGDPVWECSECGKGRHVYGIEHGTYGSDVAAHQWVACPNCGAKMDKEETE